MKSYFAWHEHRFFWFFFMTVLVIGAVFLARTDDIQTMLYVGKHRTELANFFFVSITLIGEHYLYFIIGLLWIFRNKVRLGLAIGSLGITVLGLSFGLKIWFGTPRPAATLRTLGLLEDVESISGVTYHFGNTSFPSGHTMSAFALFGFLALLQPNRPWYIACCTLIAMSVGISRVYLLQHFPTDVMAGAVIGLLLAQLWYYVYASKNFG